MDFDWVFDIATGAAATPTPAGQYEIYSEIDGYRHAPLGTLSFEAEKLEENTEALLRAILRAMPAAAKGKYVQSMSLTSTMGPGLRIDDAAVQSIEV